MRTVLTIATLCMTFLWPAVGHAQAPTQFIMRAAPGQIAAVAERHALTVIGSVDETRGIYLVSGDTDWPTLTANLESETGVTCVEQNKAVTLPEAQKGRLNQSTAAILETLPDRTLISYFDRQVWRGYVFQPAARIVGAIETHRRYGTGRGVVAIIDTGIDASHPALAGGVVAGYDFLLDQPGIPSDSSDLSQSTAAMLESLPGSGVFRAAYVNQSTAAILEQSTAAILEASGLPAAFGHGTMVAGLVRLAAPTANVMPLRVFSNDGSATTFDIVRAIYYAVDHGADVINMSFSLAAPSEELVRALNYANEKKVIAVASAGNSAEDTLVFPAALRNVIGVGSTNNWDKRSSFSNFGNALVRLAAPGEALITAYPGGGYAAVWGTSFSAGLVSGGAALLVQFYSGLDPDEADDLLTHTRPAGQRVGQRRLDLYASVRRAIRD
jgi:subtilisin family serine protease